MSQRPFFLNLMQIRLPIGGVVSILHRASGAFLSLAIPCFLYLFARSLASAEGHAEVMHSLQGGLGWVLASGAAWALLHHFIAGLRHLGLDLGWGEEKTAARRSALITLGLGVLGALVVAFGVLS